MLYTQYCNVIEARSNLHVADKAYDTKVICYIQII